MPSLKPANVCVRKHREMKRSVWWWWGSSSSVTFFYIYLLTFCARVFFAERKITATSQQHREGERAEGGAGRGGRASGGSSRAGGPRHGRHQPVIHKASGVPEQRYRTEKTPKGKGKETSDDRRESVKDDSCAHPIPSPTVTPRSADPLFPATKRDG